MQTLVEQRELEMGHARALLGLDAARQQTEVGALVAKKGLSVRETEALVRRAVDSPHAAAARARRAIDPNIRKLEQDLADKLGAKVLLQHAASGTGKLVINYNRLDELDGSSTTSSERGSAQVQAEHPLSVKRRGRPKLRSLC